MQTKRYIFAISALLLLPLHSFAEFNPGRLIEDRQFSDTQTFGSAQGIQRFLQSKKSVLATLDPSFLLKLKEPADPSLKKALDDPRPDLGRPRTAAELIWDASIKTGLNPQVILVHIQKEQTLITGDFSDPLKLQRALDVAMGFGCPDSGGCQAIFKGFYFQLFGNFDAEGNRYVGAPGSLMRSFNTVGGRGPGVSAQNEAFGKPIVRTAKTNDSITISNTQGAPHNAPPTQTVLLANAATAALYRYTPHVYNGNYNFWKFFTSWFKYPNGALIKLVSDSATYIINDGLKSLIPNFVIVSRALNPANTITVSPNELSDYESGPIYGPADYVTVRIDSDPARKVYVFLDSQRRPVSDFVLGQRGLKPSDAILITSQDADLFPAGELLPPKDNTLVQPRGSKTVFIFQNGKKMALSAFTYKQYKFTAKNIIALNAEEVDAYKQGGFLLPKDGTLIKVKDIAGTYLLQNGLIKPVSDTVFKLYKYRTSQIATFDAGELDNAGLGGYLAPPDGTYFKDSRGNYYYFKNGTKHHLSQFVLGQRAAAKISVLLSDQESDMLDDGSPLSPKDGTLIKDAQNPAIYLIKNGQKLVLDYNSWVKKYSKKKPIVLSEEEVASYPNVGDE